MSVSSDYDLTGQLAAAFDAAFDDIDRVSMLILTRDPPRPGPSNEAALVVIKGHQEIEAFRRWARAQRLLTDTDSGMGTAIRRQGSMS